MTLTKPKHEVQVIENLIMGTGIEHVCLGIILEEAIASEKITHVEYGSLFSDSPKRSR